MESENGAGWYNRKKGDIEEIILSLEVSPVGKITILWSLE
jgi:hypothetical protein